MARCVSRTWLTCIVIAALAACSKTSPEQEPVRAVKVLTLGAPSGMSDWVFSGEVRARVESNLAFRVGGKLVQRPAEIGQRVKAGQLLAQIDPQDYRASADAAASQLVAAQSNHEVAQADLNRFQSLFEQGFISLAEMQRREAAYKAAQAQWRSAQAQNTVQSNQSSYTHLTADASGVITSVEASIGQVVAAGQAVVRLAVDGPRDVVFSVPEDKLTALKSGDTVQVRFWLSGETLEARVRDVAASADSVTRSFVVKAALPKDASPVLGTTVSVQIKQGAAKTDAALKLPTSALRSVGGNSAVWVLDADAMTVKSREVTVSALDGNEVVVTQGLSLGEQVVLSGVHVLTEGQKVMLFKPAK